MLSKRVTTVTGFWVAVVLTVATLGLWGFAHRLYSSLLPGLGVGLSLTPIQTDMARSAIAIGYFLMTLPGAFISRNFGCKTGMLFGLGTFAIGIFLVYPAVQGHSVPLFIAAATVFGSGLAIVEVTALPLVVFIGSRRGAIQRSILADALSPLGALAAFYVAHGVLADAGSNPHFVDNVVAVLTTIGVAAIALAFVMEMANFPPIAEARVASCDRTLPSFLPPLRIRHFRYALVAIFLGLFAQIIIAGFAPLYSVRVMPSLTAEAANLVLVAAYLALLIGRLVGPLLMSVIAPMRVVTTFSILATLCAFASAVTRGPVAIGFLIGTSLFMSVLIPSIFAISIRDLGDMAKSAAALVQFVAFTGTGLFALLAVANASHILPVVMFLPAMCFAAITVLVLRLNRMKEDPDVVHITPHAT
jgi:MFS transporter, FHS family, L-fucose permease